MDFVPSEKGVPIRQPSTANLMIDSADRTSGTASNFSIQRSNSILNGFFTRIGTTELVLNWFQPNISAYPTEDTLVVTTTTATTTYVAPPANYTQADLINWVTEQLNLATSGITWAVENAPLGAGTGLIAIVPDGNVTIGLAGSIATKLSIATVPVPYTPAVGIGIAQADLRPFRYIDFVSTQLTYNQNVKDASTATIVRDVLARWYFAYDQPPTLDEYGFPILMGYSAFCLRRTFSPPKQIKWESNMPVGNLTFQLYNSAGALIETDGDTSWQMTLQISEV